LFDSVHTIILSGKWIVGLLLAVLGLVVGVVSAVVGNEGMPRGWTIALAVIGFVQAAGKGFETFLQAGQRTARLTEAHLMLRAFKTELERIDQAAWAASSSPDLVAGDKLRFKYRYENLMRQGPFPGKWQQATCACDAVSCIWIWASLVGFCGCCACLEGLCGETLAP